MNKTSKLRALGQSVWLDNITRDLLDRGTMRRYIAEYSVTGLTSNPTIFDEAIGKTTAYDAGIRDKPRPVDRARRCSSSSHSRITTRMRDNTFKRVLKTLALGITVTIKGPFSNLALHNNVPP